MTMAIGQQAQFVAKGYGIGHNYLTDFSPEDRAIYGQISWCAQKGNIDSTGLYQATILGNDTITVTHILSGATERAVVHVNPGNITRIVVSPKEANLTAGEQLQFIANGFDSFANEVPLHPVWTATGGVIDSTGLYSAIAAGNIYVIVSERGTIITDSANVHVEAGTLSHIEVLPSEVCLNFGEQQQFNAAGFDGFENSVEFSPLWSSTGGSISETGVFTGNEVGTFIVTATDSGTSINGIATVTVVPTGIATRNLPPTEFALFQNYPNPFNPETTIEFSVKEKCQVLLKIFDITGRHIATLVQSDFEAGLFRIVFDARNLPSGVYLCQIRMKNFSAIRKMVLLE